MSILLPMDLISIDIVYDSKLRAKFKASFRGSDKRGMGTLVW